MKTMINASKAVSAGTSYGEHYTYQRGHTKFSVYTKNDNDPANFQCQVSEIHPYDMAEYAWAEKDSPASATVYRGNKRIGYIRVPEYDLDNYEDDNEYLDTVIDIIACKLRQFNRDVEPRIDRT